MISNTAKESAPTKPYSLKYHRKYSFWDPVHMLVVAEQTGSLQFEPLVHLFILIDVLFIMPIHRLGVPDPISLWEHFRFENDVPRSGTYTISWWKRLKCTKVRISVPISCLVSMNGNNCWTNLLLCVQNPLLNWDVLTHICWRWLRSCTSLCTFVKALYDRLISYMGRLQHPEISIMKTKNDHARCRTPTWSDYKTRHSLWECKGCNFDDDSFARLCTSSQMATSLITQLSPADMFVCCPATWWNLALELTYNLNIQ